jgi:Raf kinase inhibitor-like YbhB/YbcL family protein
VSISTRIRESFQRDHTMPTMNVHRRDPYGALPTVPGFHLESSAVADGETMPVAQRSGIFGAGGDDTSPDLTWSGFPEETESFVVTMYDADAPTPSGFWHWVVLDIPASVTSLAAGAGDGDETLPGGATHLANDAGLRRYLGAAPPPGDPHRYFLVVSALDVADAGLPEGATPALASFQTLGHTIARATLVPTYGTSG